jgi:hypothetical protein
MGGNGLTGVLKSVFPGLSCGFGIVVQIERGYLRFLFDPVLLFLSI